MDGGGASLWWYARGQKSIPRASAPRMTKNDFQVLPNKMPTHKQGQKLIPPETKSTDFIPFNDVILWEIQFHQFLSSTFQIQLFQYTISTTQPAWIGG